LYFLFDVVLNLEEIQLILDCFAELGDFLLDITINKDVAVEKFDPVEYLFPKLDFFIKNSFQLLQLHMKNIFRPVPNFHQHFRQPDQLISYCG
jgi:hypothetical protein